MTASASYLTDETATKGTAPTVHRNYDAATNRLTLDYTYDANGNMTAMPGLGMTYNVENRLTQATSNLNGTESYGYDAAGLRLWKQGPDGVTHVFYNGLDGKPLAEFYPQGGSVRGGDPMVYFAGKRVDNGSVEDRLGTAVVENGQDRMAYFPYGELRSGTSTEVQFATYKRDSVTNLDYAAAPVLLHPDRPLHHAGSEGQQRQATDSRRAGIATRTRLGDPINGYDPNGTDWMADEADMFDVAGRSAPSFGYSLGQMASFAGLTGISTPPTDLHNEGTIGWIDPASVAEVDYQLTVLDATLMDLLGLERSELKDAAASFAAVLLAGLYGEDCAKDMYALGVDPSAWAAKLTSVSIELGPGSTDPLAPTWIKGQDRPANLDNMTIGAHVFGDPGTSAYSDVNGPKVYVDPIGPGINPADSQAMAALIVHETLHKLLGGMEDTAIQASLNITVDARNTQNISDTLGRDFVCAFLPSAPTLLP